MLSREQYVIISLEYNLFWLRIMKEHAIFIEGSFTPKEKQLAAQADSFMQQYEKLLSSAIEQANGYVTRDALQAAQYYTRFTEEAERLVTQFTGLKIDTNLTRMTYDVAPYGPGTTFTAKKEQDVSTLNQNALALTNSFAQYKADLLSKQTACRIFTFLYTADLEHILKEARKYIEVLTRLQNKDDRIEQDYRSFWASNMSDHAKSMRGMFDPTETQYLNEANQFANIFDTLLQSGRLSALAMNPSEDAPLPQTQAISDFKANTTRGLIECKVKAIMPALYTDHLLREANHFIYLMKL